MTTPPASAPERTAPVQPAEWAPHTACLTAWPASEDAWGPHLAAAQVEFAAFLRAFCAHAGEALWLLTPEGIRPAALSDPEIAAAERDGTLRYLPIPYGDVWLRDIAPVWLSDGSVVTFQFNGWGGKYPYPHDPEVASRIAALQACKVRAVPLVAEGGGLESDGLGTYLTTRSCLLNDNRNPGLSEAQVNALLAQHMGARRVIWLDEGLAGDHTDGHIDNIARFVAPRTVVCTRSEASDPNHTVHARIEAALVAEHDASGMPLQVRTLPSPGAVLDEDGAPVPASYMNFYIANRALFVPTYGTAADERACAQLGALFPGRRIVPVPSRAILTGGGSLHCVTQQVPA